MKIYKYHSVNINLLHSIRRQENWYSKLSFLNDPFDCYFLDNTKTDHYCAFLSSLAVCCFSKNRDEILMWSHYASNHTGVCLEFDIVGDDIIRQRLMTVEYVSDYLVLEEVERIWTGHLLLNVTSNGRFLRTKFKNWSYEEEVRSYTICAAEHQTGRAQPFLGPLTGLYFGKNASINDIALIRHNLSHLPEVKLFQVDLDTSTMKMDKLVPL